MVHDGRRSSIFPTLTALTLLPIGARYLLTVRCASAPTNTAGLLTCGSGPKGARTPDLMAASHALYQLSYGPRAASLPRRSAALGTDLRPPPPGRCGIPRTFVPSTHAADAGSARVTGGDT